MKEKDIKDVVIVDHTLFDRSKSREVAAEVAQFNNELLKKNKL